VLRAVPLFFGALGAIEIRVKRRKARLSSCG
jgi:hypothetical protein